MSRPVIEMSDGDGSAFRLNRTDRCGTVYDFLNALHRKFHAAVRISVARYFNI